MNKQYLKKGLTLSLLAAGIFTAGCNSGATPSGTSSPSTSSSMSANMVGASVDSAEAANTSVNCTGVAAWDEEKQYSTKGELVVYKGIEYQNNTWSQGDEPDTHQCKAGSLEKQWSPLGTCSDSPQPSPTVTPTTSPTPTPTTSPVPSGQYDTYPTGSGSYVAGSYVQDKYGTLYRCKNGWCNQSATAYAPGTGTDWMGAWDFVRVIPDKPTTPVLSSNFTQISCPNGDEVMQDKSSDLMWLKKPASSKYSWIQASQSPAIPNTYCGYTDWRLPTSGELHGLIDEANTDGVSSNYVAWFNSNGFSVSAAYYWTSSSHDNPIYADTFAYDLYTADGILYVGNKTYSHSVWPVRGGK